MRIIAIGVIVGLLSSGCVNYRASQGVAIVGGLGLVGTVIAGAVRKGPGPDADIDVGALFIGMAALASVTVALSGLIGMGVHQSPRNSRPSRVPGADATRAREAAGRSPETAARAEHERAAAPIQSEAVRERVLDLMKEAQAAVRADDCATVKQREVSIRALDSEFHAAVFVRDVAIKSCLDNALAQPATVEPPTERP